MATESSMMPAARVVVTMDHMQSKFGDSARLQLCTPVDSYYVTEYMGTQVAFTSMHRDQTAHDKPYMVPATRNCCMQAYVLSCSKAIWLRAQASAPYGPECICNAETKYHLWVTLECSGPFVKTVIQVV